MDLALATAYTFAGAYPRLLEVDRIAFRRPVEIGDLVRMKSRVVCASREKGLLVVEAVCQVVRPEK